MNECEVKSMKNKINTLDIFSGAGGLSFGFHMEGFDSLAAIEIDKWAANSFRKNFPSAFVIQDDIKKLSCKHIGDMLACDVDVIIGGPPCQGFSHANVVNHDPKDPRNSLFEEFVRLTKYFSPKAIVIENVPPLLKARTSLGEKVIEIINRELSDLDYDVFNTVLNASHYGVPQNRERLFIVGFKKCINAKNKEIESFFERHKKREISLWDAISDLPLITSEHNNNNVLYEHDAKNDYQIEMREGAPFYISHHEPMRHTQRIIERFKMIGFGESEEDIPEEHAPLKRGNPKEKSTKKYSQNSRRQHPDHPCNAVVASSHTNFIHPYLHRNFTVRELMRIQSFPDRFSLYGKRAVLSKKLCEKKGLLDDMHLDQRMQIGNAVPPLLAKVVAQMVKEIAFTR